MAKATLVFSLPEERYDYNNAVNGHLWRSIVHDLSINLRNHLKHGHEFKTADEALEAIKTLLWDDCKDARLDPWSDD